MAPRNPEGKRKRLLDAALTEFAEYGTAGARVDRIARNADISSGLVYAFAASKAELFDAVLEQVVADSLAAVPITVDDLPGYAGRLYDNAVANPRAARVLAWYQLERGEAPPPVSAALKPHVAAIRKAQRAGTVSDRLDAPALLGLITTIAGMSTDLVPKTRRRATVVNAVRLLVEP